MNKRVVVGCGILCCLFLLGILTMLVFGYNRFARLQGVATRFVGTAMAGDLETAYGELHAVKRQDQTLDQFAAEWEAVRALVGDYQQLEMTGPPGLDAARAVMVLSYTIHGSAGTAGIEIDVNPNDKPMQVVDYRLQGLPETALAEADDAIPVDPNDPAVKLAQAFVQAALQGDLADAYQRLDKAKQETIDEAGFEAHWKACLDSVGEIQGVVTPDKIRSDGESLKTVTLLIPGAAGVGGVEVDLDTTGNAPKIVDYRLLSFPEADPNPVGSPAQPAAVEQ